MNKTNTQKHLFFVDHNISKTLNNQLYLCCVRDSTNKLTISMSFLFCSGLKHLKCLGNFAHNVNSIKQNKNDIVVVKRPTKQRLVHEYLPCIHCYGFYVIEELWKHTKNCQLKSSDISTNQLDVLEKAKKLLSGSSAIKQSKLLLDTACLQEQVALSVEMRALVLSMHQDDLCEVVKRDTLLHQFGETLIKKYGPRKKNDIGQRLRQLARLLLKCREDMSNNLLGYMELLCGKHFDACLSGTFALCKLYTTVDGRREFKIPSLALRLGHLLKKMATIKQGYCLRQDHIEGLKQAENFRQLLETEWTDAIATNAHNTLKRRKDHSIQMLPLTDDLRELRCYQIKEMRQCIDQLQEAPLYSIWRKLAQLTMARMIIFNKRRGGEVSKLLLETYISRPNWKDATNQEVMSSLQPLEQKLLERVDLVQIPGKKNRKVPMLITADVKEAIECLHAHRNSVGILPSNPFCFASRSAGHLDSWQAMSSIAHEASLKQPDLVTSTKLRKYNATVSQLFDLNNGELEWLSNHMGHDLNIHKDFYRLHDSTIEIAKVSRLLMAIDSGNAAQFVGKQLTDISLEDFGSGEMGVEIKGIQSQVADGSESVHETRDNEQPHNQTQKSDLPTSSAAESVHETSDRDNEQPHNPMQESDMPTCESVEDDNNWCNTKKTKHTKKRSLDKTLSDSDDEIISQNKAKKSRRHHSPWTTKEIGILENAFDHQLTQGIYPSGQQIKATMSINPCLKKRTVLNVRAKLQHLMKKYRTNGK